MTEPLKDRSQILANQKAFWESLGRARGQLGQMSGVVAVGAGQKETAGEFKDSIAIVVFVQEKKRADELPPEQLVPESFEGYPTDVRVVLSTSPGACDNNAEYSTIQGGIQVTSGVDLQTGAVEDGTLGCIVRKRHDAGRENVYLLTNKHVLFMHGADVGSYAYHPYPANPDRNRFADRPSTTLGPIQPGAYYTDVPYTPPGSTTSGNFFIDCAWARVDIDSKCCGTTCTKDTLHYATEIIDLQLNGVNTLSDVRNVIGDLSILTGKAFKVGRTTGKTQGIVRFVDAPVNTHDPTVAGNPPVSGHNTIQIDFDPSSTSNGLNCKGNARFAEHGDSGSIVVDEQGRVIGLLSQVAPDGAPSAYPVNACHILPVLDILNLCIPTTTGTSHGSCGATDGSGTAAAAAALASPAPAPGGGGISPMQMMAEVTGAPAFAEPALANEAEIRHLQELLSTLRKTESGRQLHDEFAHVRREIGYLIRNCRPVKVAWHRNEGPNFLAHAVNHLKGRTDSVPREINGVSWRTLLGRMAELLARFGSKPLRQAIDQHRHDLLEVLDAGNCFQDWIRFLQQKAFV